MYGFSRRPALLPLSACLYREAFLSHDFRIASLRKRALLAGYIDLSKRRVSQEDILKCEEKFAKAKAVRKWLNISVMFVALIFNRA